MKGGDGCNGEEEERGEERRERGEDHVMNGFLLIGKMKMKMKRESEIIIMIIIITIIIIMDE